MPSATPIYDALAKEMLGPLTDFVPQWLIGGRTESLRPPSEARTRAQRISSQPGRHRLI